MSGSQWGGISFDKKNSQYLEYIKLNTPGGKKPFKFLGGKCGGSKSNHRENSENP